MYLLYKKVPKREDNPRGVEQVKESENPFLDGPCLLCVSAMYEAPIAKKSNFGIVKRAMNMMRMRIRDSYNAGFDIDSFPITLLAMEKDVSGIDRNQRSFQLITSFVNKYIVPLISENDGKIDLAKAMKNMRNVNIMPYCDGTMFTQELESIMLEKMESIGYTSEEAKKIQSQMFVMPISTMRLYGADRSTIISFKDINDREIRYDGDDVTPEKQKAIEESPTKEILYRRSGNEYDFLYSGDGAHRLKKYMTDGYALPACIVATLGYALENAIQNSRGDTLVELRAEDIASKIEEVLKMAREGKTQEELIEFVDSTLSYGGARRMSREEAKLLDRIDRFSDAQITAVRDLERAEDQADRLNERLGATTAAAAKFCTTTNYKRILKATGYQFGEKDLREIESTPSDKELIESYQKQKALLIEDALKTAVQAGVTQDEVKAVEEPKVKKLEKTTDEEIK